MELCASRRSGGSTLAHHYSVLICEDDIGVREAEVEHFAIAGFKVIEAINGKEAVQKCSLQKFDLVVMDMNMPRMQGDEAIVLIRAETMNRDTPIVVLSACLDRTAVESLRGKVQKAFTKPINLRDLVGYAKTLVGEGEPPAEATGESGISAE